MAEFQSWSGDYGSGVHTTQQSPGGFEFGVTGWIWPNPVPSSVTFYLDNTAGVFDQWGRPIKGVVLPSGREVRFANAPPRADDSDAVLRKQFATHAEVVEVLLAEGVDLIAEMNSVGSPCPRCQGTGRSGERQCRTCRGSGRKAVVSCAGWPQLTYEQLKKLSAVEWPFDRTCRKNSSGGTGQRCGCVNCSIRDPALRRDAMRVRAEAAAAATAEQEAAERLEGNRAVAGQ